MKRLLHIGLLLISMSWSTIGLAHDHPSLAITKEGVKEIRARLGTLPILDQTIEQAIKDIKVRMQQGIIVPMPKDLAGGYSHEQHKLNFFTLQKAGLLFQITGEEKYAIYIRDVLLEYARIFPTFDHHPATRSYAPGKFFWQCLNDANWLVYVSQAYDCVYDWLDKTTREKLNKELFRPYADYISIKNPQFFNRIHNHSTWGNAAVGMVGLVIEDDELVERALYGLDKGVPTDVVRDNDGGLIELPDQKEAGFYAQIDHSFSPDGYYTEGPYYQRYAMYPFMAFAQALQNTQPELKIFKYKDSVLNKAVFALLNMTNAAGEFFPINDAQKGMSYLSRELVLATDIAYHYGGQDLELLSIAKQQDEVSLSDAGLDVAMGLSSGREKPFVKKSLLLHDGATGKEGAIGILRSKNSKDFCLVMKYTKHGMGHGHFDELSISYYNGANEIYQDYGAARWVNIEQKDGGGYLKENTSWAKETIAHNTVVVNEKSQYNAKVSAADLYHGMPYLFDTTSEGLQIMSAKDTLAYEGVSMQRTVVLIENEIFSKPVMLDLFRVSSPKDNKYDLPHYYHGAILETTLNTAQSAIFKPLGTDFGYQHVMLEAQGNSPKGGASINWLYKGQFYTQTSNMSNSDNMLFGHIGGTDPSFNLRHDPVFILRKKNSKSPLFASVTETHGTYSPVTEIAKEAYGKIKSIEILKNTDRYSAVELITKEGYTLIFTICNNNSGEATQHHLVVKDMSLDWQGPYLFKIEKNKS